MARGRLFSRKYEPAKPLPRDSSPNPLVQLGLAFKNLQKLAPEAQPSPVQDNIVLPGRRPLVDINDVRKFIRAKLGITEEVSTIPLNNPSPNPSSSAPRPRSSDAYEFSETTHMSSAHSFSSDASSLPQHDAATGARVFDIGTVGHPILEVRSSSSQDSSEAVNPASTSYTWILEPPDPGTTSRGQLDMRDVQEFVGGVVEFVKRFENWGLPKTSWENKMPWHSPPPKILARGLQRPPESFASEEEEQVFNRLARRRKPFLTGCPPTWSFMVANFALIAFLLYNPLGR